jgi:TatD DNase family protein
MTMLVDSHCHLDFPDFASELDAVVARARAADVRRMVTISTRVRRLDGLRAIASTTCSVRSAHIRITRTKNWISRPPISWR